MKNYANKNTSKSLNFDYVADKVILLMASLSLMVFVIFAWTIAEATKVNAKNADLIKQLSDQSCRGKDLIADFTANNPNKLKLIEEKASKIINGKSVFWKIEKAGIPTSYMLGTMHMADDRIAKLDGKRLEAFNKTDLLIVENTDALDPAKAQAAMAKLQHLTMLKSETLHDLLDAESLKRLEPLVTSRGIPFAIATKLRPWLVATTISIPACEILAKQSGKPVLDALLAQKANEAGKKIIGLESVEEQLSAIANMPREFHLSALKETLNLGDEIKDVLETLKLLYLAGDIAKIQPLMKVVSPKTSSLSDNKRFEEQLIINRNKIMAKRARQYLEKGNIFLAVGALHLPDQTGLVKLFQDLGYSVFSIN